MTVAEQIRQVAEIAGVSVRQMERFLVVRDRGVPELMTAVLANPGSGYVPLGPAERIARLPADQQPDALSDYFAGKASPRKREARTITSDLEAISAHINKLNARWSQVDRRVACAVLHDFARQLAGLEAA